MEQDKVLERVRKLLERAEHPGTPEQEADSARQMADDLMLKYAIEQADLDATRPAAQRSTPEVLNLNIIRANSPVQTWMVDIAGYVASHCRSRIVFHGLNDEYTRLLGKNIRATVIGYESDLRYFELLFTMVQLHFSGAVDPKVDESLSFSENCYRFHEAGITYRKMVHMLFPEVDIWTPDAEIRKLGGRCKTGYRKACRERGESPRAIPNPDVYQKSFARAYAMRIWERLSAMERNQSAMSTALVRRTESVAEKVQELFPDLMQIDSEDDGKTDIAGLMAGRQAGSEVDLTGTRVGSSNKPRLS
jgi:Protein of unknown function (DUF2786)